MFARNEIPFTDPTGVDHDTLGIGLRKALYNYMLGAALDQDPRIFFDTKVPRPTVPKRFIERALETA